MVHSGEKSNQCNQCHYVCCDPSALRRHLKTHIREKTSKCNQCQFASHQVGNLRRHLLNGGENKDEYCYIFLWSTTCRVVVLTCSVLKIAKSKQKSESFSLNISLWDISAFPFLAGILAFWLIKSINGQRNIREKYSEKIPSEYEYEYYSVSRKWPNTNTNIIRLPKKDRIRILFSFTKKDRIRILFGSPKIHSEEK